MTRHAERVIEVTDEDGTLFLGSTVGGKARIGDLTLNLHDDGALSDDRGQVAPWHWREVAPSESIWLERFLDHKRWWWAAVPVASILIAAVVMGWTV